MKKEKKLFLVAAVSLLIVVCVGVSYAWFSQRAALATLMNIMPPDDIKIVPVDDKGGDALMLDLDFDADKYGDVKNEETGEITIRRPVYIWSTSPIHQLEIVHTTNLNQLSFNIYPATKNEDNSITYDTAKKLTGEYKNKKDASLAKEEPLNNYKNGDNVEAHAYPLYWLAGNSGDEKYVSVADRSQIVTTVTSKSEKQFDPAKQVEKTYYKTYYIIEITWQENSKETDLFYIMAQNCAVTATEGSVSEP